MLFNCEHCAVTITPSGPVLLQDAIAVSAHEVGHLEGWPRHRLWSRRVRRTVSAPDPKRAVPETALWFGSKHPRPRIARWTAVVPDRRRHAGVIPVSAPRGRRLEPEPVDAPFAQNRRATWFTVVGRVKRGVSASEAQADLDSVQAQLGREYPATDAALGVRVRPLKDVIVGGTGRSLWLLFAAVSLLLLIACSNIAALLLARTADRQQEISIRYSLGASRTSIVRQLLTEALVLAILGSVVGLLVAAGAFRMFHVLAGNLPRMTEVRLDWTLVAYSLVCAAGATLVFGLLPAVGNTSRQTSDSLAQRSRTVAPATHRLQWAARWHAGRVGRPAAV